uniref:C-type lectin domain-containing protein n=1 Tax=Echeneis naucrates TaxID=173247 RepID=A0A665VKM1_ECHNA
MEEGENYSSLQELRPGGNRPMPGYNNGTLCAYVLRVRRALLMLIGFLVSFCASIVLTVLLFPSSFYLSIPLLFSVERYSECSEGWLHLDWWKNKDSGSAMGGHLTVLHTIAQHVCVNQENDGFYYHFWIGLCDIENEGDWRLVDNTTLKHNLSKTWIDAPCHILCK